jgi:hypothetical protein
VRRPAGQAVLANRVLTGIASSIGTTVFYGWMFAIVQRTAFLTRV